MTRGDYAQYIGVRYLDLVQGRLGETNDWIVRLMRACLDLYAVQAGAKTLAQTSLASLAAEGQWVQAMEAERDRVIAAINAAATEADALAVVPAWPTAPA